MRYEVCIYRIGNPCRNLACDDNIFYHKLQLKKPKETNVSRRLKNCTNNLDTELTLQEIADMWGLTRERVRQIEDKGLHKLRKDIPAFKNLAEFLK